MWLQIRYESINSLKFFLYVGYLSETIVKIFCVEATMAGHHFGTMVKSQNPFKLFLNITHIL